MSNAGARHTRRGIPTKILNKATPAGLLSVGENLPTIKLDLELRPPAIMA
jgi:hypothetical protein